MVRSLIFDTETTGLPRDKHMPANLQKGNWPDIVSISWRVYDDSVCIAKHSFIVKPEGWTIPPESTKIHGITPAAAAEGVSLVTALVAFCEDISTAERIVAHNLSFDKQVVLNAIRWRLGLKAVIWSPLADICTGVLSTNELKLTFPGRNSPGFYKMPSLKELYKATFSTDDPPGAHNSARDVEVLEEIILKRWPKLLG
jgi:DNA polymerase-3 subunit alpha